MIINSRLKHKQKKARIQTKMISTILLVSDNHSEINSEKLHDIGIEVPLPFLWECFKMISLLY
jgi:hypothetical protein